VHPDSAIDGLAPAPDAATAAHVVAPTCGATELATSMVSPVLSEPAPANESSEAAPTLRELIGHGPWRRWLVASMAARLPLSMLPLAFVLVGQAADGSVTLGATLTGFGSLCACLAAPVRGRLLDRQELRRALQIDSLVAAGVFALLLVVLQFDLPTALLFVLSVGGGWSIAGMMSGLRALLVVAVPAEQLRRSHFVESLLTEVCYGLGPILVGVLGLLGGAKLVLLVMFAIQASAALSLRRIGTFAPRRVSRTKLLGRRDVRRLTALTFFVSLGYGTLESNVPQRMGEFGLSTEVGGWFLGILAAGSCIGGMLASIRPTSARYPRLVAAVLALAFAVLIIPSALARTAPLYGFTLVISTLAFVPIVGLLAAEFESRLGVAQRGEGFAYFVTALTLGGAVGYLGNGLLIGPLAASTMPWLAAALFGVVGAMLLASCAPPSRRRPMRTAATTGPHS
jgi:MFS family permease